MDLNALHAKRILLFGSPRSLSREEFERLLQSAGITLAAQYDEAVAVAVEGRLVNPIEQAELDRLYDVYRIVPVEINAFEQALCSQLDPDRIMMSLKLTRDRERLRSFLQNPHIDDAFFLKLLGMYDWHNEGFFDNDENRDVTAALIGRFYDHIERNHNVQYSALGLMHLIGRHADPALIRALGALPPLRRAVSVQDRQLRAVLDALAVHPAADETTLKYFLRQGDDALRVLIATRPGLPVPLQQELYRSARSDLLAALAANPDLEGTLADTLFETARYAEIGYRAIRLDDARFGQGLARFAPALAANPSLTLPMQQRLLALPEEPVRSALAANPALQIADALAKTGSPETLLALAANPALPSEQFRSLSQTGRCDAALAGNPSAPATLLEALYAKGEPDTLRALAANPATPIVLLQQLQLDARFERAVRGNEAFSAYIKRENIGWI